MKRILVITAVRPETRAALRALSRARRIRPAAPPCWQGSVGANHVTVIQAGVGPEAVRRVLGAVSASYNLIVSLGFAGALVPGPAPGDFVLSETVLWEEDGQRLRYDVPRRLFDTVEIALPPEIGRSALRGAIFSSPVVLATAAAKEEAARNHGAVAVEMEAAALAGYATQHGVPFVALRAILDPVNLSLEGLPKNLDTSWAVRARLFATPATWPLLVALRRHATTAAITLGKVAAAVFPAFTHDE